MSRKPTGRPPGRPPLTAKQRAERERPAGGLVAYPQAGQTDLGALEMMRRLLELRTWKNKVLANYKARPLHMALCYVSGQRAAAITTHPWHPDARSWTPLGLVHRCCVESQRDDVLARLAVAWVHWNDSRGTGRLKQPPRDEWMREAPADVLEIVQQAIGRFNGGHRDAWSDWETYLSQSSNS